MIKLAFVSDLDVHDINSWSGSTYYMAKGLEKQSGLRINYISPLKNKWKTLCKIKQKGYRLLGKSYSYRCEPLVLSSYARQVEAKIKKMRPDVVFSCGKPPVVYLKCDMPLVFCDDASVPAIMKIYPTYKNIRSSCLKVLINAERRLLNNACLALYSSEWAAEAAINYFNVNPPGKVKVVPWGANLECNRDEDQIGAIINQRLRSNNCKILFIGKDWGRKGGDIVLRVAECLHNSRIPIVVDVLGCRPPHEVPEYIKVHGFISKSNPQGKARIDGLFRESHFLLVPSEADCTPIVFAEASSYGLPSISRDVGGISTMICSGQNGMVFSFDEEPEQYARYISDKWSDKDEYEELSRSAFSYYRNDLNWNVFGKRVLDLLERI